MCNKQGLPPQTAISYNTADDPENGRDMFIGLRRERSG